MGNTFSSKKTREFAKVKELLLQGDAPKIQKYIRKLKKSKDINSPFPELGCKCHPGPVSFLHYAAAFCPSSTVVILCDEGHMDVNSTDTPTGETPLMYAVLHCNSANILPLKLRNCNLDAKNHDRGDTAFHYACINGDMPCVEALVAAGVDLLQTNKDGRTGLDCAKYHKNLTVAQFIEAKMTEQRNGAGYNRESMSNIRNSRILSEFTNLTHSNPDMLAEDLDNGVTGGLNLLQGTSERWHDTEPLMRKRFDHTKCASVMDTILADSGSIPFLDDSRWDLEVKATPNVDVIRRSIRHKTVCLKDEMKPGPILDEMFASGIIDAAEHTKQQKLSDTEKNDYILQLAVNNNDQDLPLSFIDMLHKSGQTTLARVVTNKT